MKWRLKAKAVAPNRFTAGASTVKLEAAPGEIDGKPQRPSFAINAYNGDVIRPSWSYGGRVVIDLKGLRAAEPVAILLDHNHESIVGQSTEVKISASSIDMLGIVTGDTANPDDPACKVVMHAKNGFQWKASIGVMPERVEEVNAGKKVTVNGKEFTGPIYVLRAGVLDEVSFLSIGADKTASAKVAASAAKGINMEFHEWLKAKGFDPSTLDDTQRDSLLKAFKAEEAADAALKAKGNSGGADLDAVLAPVKLKQQRRAAVNACVAKFAELHPGQIEAIEAAGRCALAEDWTAERLELHFFREIGSNPVNNTPRASSGGGEDARTVEAAMCRAGGLGDLEKHYPAEVLDRADRKFRRGIGLKQLLHIAARSNGYSTFDTHDVNDDVLHAAFDRRDRLRATGGSSVFDISGVLSNVMNKFIVQYFLGVETAWQLIAGRANLQELKHGTLGETSYTLQADTYGKIFAIDRRDIINDDLNAFTEVGRRLGRGGALALNHAFWTAFLNNTATFFAAANNNFFSGATTALGVASLETAEANFMKLTDPNGKPMAILPAILLVPPELKRTALALMNSTEVRDTTASTKFGTKNTFQGEFKVGSSVYMSNSAYTGYSAKKWYLLADPNDVPVMKVGFLNGVERPTIEQAMADFDTLGIKMRGFWDFAVGQHEPRGGVAMKGEA